jgi:hypothetical protein
MPQAHPAIGRALRAYGGRDFLGRSGLTGFEQEGKSKTPGGLPPGVCLLIKQIQT